MANDTTRKVAVFGAVGIGASVVHICIAWLAASAFQTPILIANAIGFAAGFIASYLGHYFLTFKSDRGHTAAFFRFVAVALLGFLINNCVVIAWIYLTGNQSMWSIVMAIAVAAMAVFFTSNFWAFKSKR